MKAQTERMVAPARRRSRARAAPEPCARRLEGNLDGCSRDGSVTGWCWYPTQPGAHVTLAVVVDGQLVGTTHATAYRPDLLAAGIGDGTYGFTFALPWSALDGRGFVSVNVRDEASGRLLGPPVRLRLGPMSATEGRVAEMERQIRQLRAEIAELSASLARRDDPQPSASLFATLGAVFSGLAQGSQGPDAGAGVLPDLSLGHALAQLRSRHAPFTMAIAATPRATIVVPAGPDLAQLHRCLLSLHQAGTDEIADIVVLDTGMSPPELDLWPNVIRNLRCVGGAGHVAHDGWADLARTSRADTLVCLSPLLTPQPGWLASLLSTLAREARAALVSGSVVGADGLLRHLGLGADAGGLPLAEGLMQPACDPRWRYLRSVDAVGALGFAVRRAAFIACGGLDPIPRGRPGIAGAADPDPLALAVLSLCLRLRAAGHDILVQPQAVALCDDDAACDSLVADLDAETPEAAAIRPAWHARPAAPRPLGRALVIDTALPRPQRDAGSVATLDQILTLRGLGYHVIFAASDGIDARDPQAAVLEALGTELVRPPASLSITDHLLHHGATLDLVLVWRHANAALFHDRLRSLAPRARIVFAPADLHHLREDRRRALRGRRGGDATDIARLRAAELHCVARADATIVHSDAEYDLLRQSDAEARLCLLRWIARPDPARATFADRADIGFIGNFDHSPNEDGVRWFLAKIMPGLRRLRPEIVLRIAGSGLSPAFASDLAAMAGAGVVVDGWIDDLPAWFARLRLTVAPLRYGAGFKGKVATSLSFGVPVIATSMAAEGTGLRDGCAIAIADAPTAFAARTAELYGDEDAWTRQSAHATERCRALYSPQAAMGVYRGLLAEWGLPVAGTG